MLDLSDVFGHDGPLERALPDFKVRRQQLRMAERVAAAVEARETLAVEAGTGTGKTFAYLVPALLSGVRILVSTGTRTLQDQLFAKDLPLVAAALGRPAKVALLKGRSNYLCRYRLAKSEIAAEFGIDFDERFADELSRLGPLEADGMIVRTPDGFELTSWGRVFVRNVCMVFDAHLPQPGQRAFSRTL